MTKIILFIISMLFFNAHGQIEGRIIGYVERRDDGGFVVYNDAYEKFAVVPNNNADLVQAIMRVFDSYGNAKFTPLAKAEIAEILHYGRYNLANAVAIFNPVPPVRNVVGRSDFYKIQIDRNTVWFWQLEDYEMPDAEGVENE